MTCIVGLLHEGTVWLGGDSAAVDDRHYLVRTANPKVFRSGELIIGYTSSFRMGQLLQHRLEVAIPEGLTGDDLDTFMMREFSEAVRSLLSCNGWAKVENGRQLGGNFLIGVRGGLYVMEDEFHVLRTMEPFNAIGSGVSVALGALYATPRRRPEDRIRIALEAAQAFTTSVRAPFHVVSA